MRGIKAIGRISYWLAAVALIAAILVSLDYTYSQAIFVGLLFCPCALALEYWLPKARKVTEKIYLSLAVLVSSILLILVLHSYIGPAVDNGACLSHWKDAIDCYQPGIPCVHSHDSFIRRFLLGQMAFQTLSRIQPQHHFLFSDRKSVTLQLQDIAYIESNDTEVRIYTISGESFRNKTGISQWEALLGDGFLRIHRSYLTNMDHSTLIDADTISVEGTCLPVSRKYKEAVTSILKTN